MPKQNPALVDTTAGRSTTRRVARLATSRCFGTRGPSPAFMLARALATAVNALERADAGPTLRAGSDTKPSRRPDLTDSVEQAALIGPWLRPSRSNRNHSRAPLPSCVAKLRARSLRSLPCRPRAELVLSQSASCATRLTSQLTSRPTRSRGPWTCSISVDNGRRAVRKRARSRRPKDLALTVGDRKRVLRKRVRQDALSQGETDARA